MRGPFGLSGPRHRVVLGLLFFSTSCGGGRADEFLGICGVLPGPGYQDGAEMLTWDGAGKVPAGILDEVAKVKEDEEAIDEVLDLYEAHAAELAPPTIEAEWDVETALHVGDE